jgi:hypothetical protein
VEPRETGTLSVVVAIVDGGAALSACLAALRAQDGAQTLDLVVPFDSLCDVSAARALDPRARWIDLGELASAHAPASLLALHERIDRRRAAGLAAASGEIVALIEDRVLPERDWARRLLAAHAAQPGAAAIGGAVRCGSPELLARAVCACDYGRYAPPFPAGPAEQLSDVNVSYKRAALDATRESWRERFHESSVHWQLREQGALLWATPEAVVSSARRQLALGALLRERVAFGRVFGWTRAARVPLARRLLWLALTPALPFLLSARRVAERAQRGALSRDGFVAALPAIFALSCAWSLGEALAYATGRA